MDVYTFGELLTTFRKQHHISQNELAEKLDVHRNTIGRWERGTGLPESKTIVLELAKQLHLNTNETQQLLEASLTAASPHWLMPYQRNPFFTGRESVLQQLHNVLAHERSALLSQSYSLSGLGGIGKTQTAVEYAYRYANEYATVFWISAETNESIVSSFVAIAELLNLPEKQEKEQSRVIAAVTRWLTSHSDWLVVFDNVEDLELVKGALPPARCGSLLFTSRRQALGFAAQTLDMEQMTPEEGTCFLLHRARLLGPTAPLDSLAPEVIALAREIVVVMDGLPLALDQAGAYIEETKCSLSDYLQLFQSSRLRLLDERDTHADHPSSVTRTFALAFEQLKKNNPSAAELLTVCAFLASEAIPETFFIEGATHLGSTFEKLAADPFEFHTAIKALLTYSLIQLNAETRMVTIHRLVQAVLKGLLSEAEQSIWMRRVLRALDQLIPSNKHQADYWQICERLLPHAQICVTFSELWDESEVLHVDLIRHVATLLFKTGQYLVERGRYTEAEPLLKRAIWIWEQLLGSEHINVTPSLAILGKMYYQQGRYKDADQLLRRALQIREQVQGMVHPDLVYLLNMQGNIYKDQARYEEAETVYQRAIQIGEQKQGTEYFDLASPLNGLGNVYLSQGKYEEAEVAYQQAIQIEEQEYGTEYLGLAHQLSNLACLYCEQGKYEKMEPLLKRALHIRERILGHEHSLVAYPLNGLGALYYRQGRYEEAESLLKDVVRIWEQASGKMYPNLAYPLSTLGNIYQEQGNYQEAEALYLRAVNIREQQMGKEHPDLAISLTRLSSVYYEQEKYEEAEPLLQRALFLCQQYLGPRHPDFAETLHHLARFHQLQQHTVEALSLYQQALTIREQALGFHHPKTNATCTAYIQLLQEQGCVEEAAIVEAQGRAPESSLL